MVLYSQHGSAYGVVIMAQMEESDGIDPNECQASVGSAAATQVTMPCSSLRLGLGRGDHHKRGSQFDRGSTPKIKWDGLGLGLNRPRRLRSILPVVRVVCARRLCSGAQQQEN